MLQTPPWGRARGPYLLVSHLQREEPEPGGLNMPNKNHKNEHLPQTWLQAWLG